MDQSINQQQPAIEQAGTATTTYNIYHLLFIAFFFGAVPVLALGTKVANGFNISKKISYSLIFIGLCLLLGKYWAFSLIFQGTLQIKAHVIRYGYKIACVLLYYLYLSVLNTPYKQHLARNGEITPILKPAITWIVVGLVVEFVLLGIVR